MLDIIWIVIVIAVVIAIGSGLAYLVWIKTRPVKPTWNARVFQLSEGVKIKNIQNHEFKLQELRPYIKDVLERVDKDEGITIYRLQRLKIPTPPVEGDVVDVWQGEREVNILLHKGSCTILKRSYDQATGEMIFDPMPFSRINLMTSQISMRKKRLESDKDIITAITPWIIAGICCISLIAIAYFMINGYVTISDNNVIIQKSSENLLQLSMNMTYGARVYNPAINNNVGLQPVEKTYPSVEG